MGDFKLIIFGFILSTATDTQHGCCSQDYIPGGASANQVTSTVTTQTPQTFSSSASSSTTSQTTDAKPGPGPGPGDERCSPGARRACAQKPSGEAIDFPISPPVGRCRLGEQKCNIHGQWEPCYGAIPPEKEDSCNMPGDDSNCDGTANEGCECVAIEQDERPCGSDVGECKKGKQFCENGVWGKCVGDKVPAPELCNGLEIDRDCDGAVDLRDNNCECLTTDLPQTCTLANQKGDCSLGIKTCESGQWSPCRPRFFVIDELCGSRPPDAYGSATGDEDCDGQVDEADPTKKEHPWPLGCRYFALDADQDGFGAKGPSALEDPQNPTWGCFCSTPSHLPTLVETSGKDKVDQDCGECDPNVPDIAYPVFLPTGSQCLKDINWIGGEYDYNCDEKSKPRYTGFANATCELHFSGKCLLKRSEHGFWYIPPGQPRVEPKCGEKGLGGIYCSSGKTDSGQPTCTLAWWEVDQVCR